MQTHMLNLFVYARALYTHILHVYAHMLFRNIFLNIFPVFSKCVVEPLPCLVYHDGAERACIP